MGPVKEYDFEENRPKGNQYLNTVGQPDWENPSIYYLCLCHTWSIPSDKGDKILARIVLYKSKTMNWTGFQCIPEVWLIQQTGWVCGVWMKRRGVAGNIYEQLAETIIRATCIHLILQYIQSVFSEENLAVHQWAAAFLSGNLCEIKIFCVIAWALPSVV